MTFNVRLPEIYQVEVTNACNMRCLRGDTLIDTIYGRVPIRELSGTETIPVYTYKDGEVFIADAYGVRRTGINEELVRVSFDDGTHIDCTSDHQFLRFTSANADCESIEVPTHAIDLRPRDRVRAYRKNYTSKDRRRVALCIGHPCRSRIPNVAGTSWRKEINHRVVSVEWLAERDDVYCLTVPSTGWFFANKVLVKNCDFCPRDLPGIRRPDTFIDIELVHTIAERDLGGSYFVEFQLAGEPTLHKQLPEIIQAFAGKVLTGLSTNGSSMHGANVHRGLLLLDYLTISIDSVEDYESVRPGGNWKRLIENIDYLLASRREENGSNDNRDPFIDLQLIDFPGVERQHELLRLLAQMYKWNVQIRTIPDCFLDVTRELRRSNNRELCLNPWLSVSVQADGDVTPCCHSFGKEIVYGNLHAQTLEEIWAMSPVVKAMRRQHLSGKLPKLCENCYARSPVLLHWNLYQRTVKDRVIKDRSDH